MRARVLFLSLFFVFLAFSNVKAGFYVNETDNADLALVGFFDLRERETFIQLTNVINGAQTLHVQIFDVENNCNENNFFDTYTGNDTHVYNLRDIITNDGNPSGVVLPNNSYGIFSVVVVDNPNSTEYDIIGNSRIEDNNGYEYRTNLAGIGTMEEFVSSPQSYYINFNSNNGIAISDIVGVHLDDSNIRNPSYEFKAANILETWVHLDVDIYNQNEVPFSCRNVIFACTDQENPLVDELLEVVANESEGGASVASIEYGINDAIPHSRGGELLCPGNNITDGFVKLEVIDYDTAPLEFYNFVLFVGFNNGNGRGAMDLAWYDSSELGL